MRAAPSATSIPSSEPAASSSKRGRGGEADASGSGEAIGERNDLPDDDAQGGIPRPPSLGYQTQLEPADWEPDAMDKETEAKEAEFSAARIRVEELRATIE